MSKYAGRVITDLAPAGYSVAFDGNGDYLSVADNAAFDLGSGNFTFEAWVYPTAFDSSYNVIVSQWPTSGTNAWIVRITSTYIGFVANISGTQTYDFSTTVNLNEWMHICFTRSGTTLTAYKNGVQVGATQTITGTISDGTGSVTVGVLSDLNNTTEHTGYISNLRIVKGSVVYTAAFTPPTQLFPITNTSLLTCQSPSIIDNSSNAFAITTNGNAAVSTFTPFAAYNPYNPSLGASTPGVWTLDEAMQAAATRQWNMYDPSFQNTTLLLHGNGTNGAQNNTFLDSSSNNFTITRNGNTTQGSFSPFSQTGWSNYFDGTGDYLQSPTSSAFALGTGDFCVECWVYISGGGVAQGFFQPTTDNLNVQRDISGNIGAWDGTTRTTSTPFLSNSWNHVAFSRSSSTVRLFLNGVQATSWTSSVNYSTNMGFIIGYTGNGSFPITGYIEDFRVVKGSAVYTANFTPPTAPLTAVTNTQLLTCQSNRFIDNSTNAFTITRNGDVSVQAFSPFYPTAAYTPQTIGGSGYFDGTTDYLTVANNAAFQLGTGDFTLECWYYPEDISLVALFGLWGPTSSNASYLMYLDASGYPVWYTSTNGSTQTASLTSTVAVTLRAWNHIVITRLSGTTRIFVNGTSGGSTSTSVSLYAATSQFTIGYNPIGGTPDNVQGYLSDVRILKGTGYSSITVPTAPLTNITNTSLLLNFTNAGIVDSTAKNVLETVGNAQISTTQSKFGGGSMSFDGTDDRVVSYSEQAKQSSNFGTGDFTIEFWIYFNNLTGNQGIMDNATSTTTSAAGQWYIYKPITTNKIEYGQHFVGGILTSTNSVSATTWTHIAVARSGSTVKLFINGTEEASATSTVNWNAGNGLQIGLTATPNYLNGYIDDLRITKGVARYTANFTPQTSQWQDQ